MADAAPAFDPTQPFEAVDSGSLPAPAAAAPQFDPSQPFEAVAAPTAAAPAFDPSQPFEPVESGGAMSVFAREAAQAPINIAGSMIQGAALTVNAMTPTAVQTAGGEGSPLSVEDLEPPPAEPVQQNPALNRVYKAGEAVQNFAKTAIPVSDAERQLHPMASSFGSGVGTVGSIIALGAIDPAAAMAGGAALFGFSGAADTYNAAKAKGASEDTAMEAASLSGAVNTALGVIPVGNVLRPFAKFMPEASGWAMRVLAQAAQNGITFGGVAEAQNYLGQQVAKLYDKDAGYDMPFTTRMATERLLGELAAGALLGGFHGVFHELANARNAPPADVAPEQRVADLQNILGESPTAPPPAAPPPVEDQSILGGERPVSERQSLQTMIDRGAPVADLAQHPMVQRALEQNRAAVPTGSLEDFQNPEWRAQRVYNFDGEQVQGWDSAVDRLTSQAQEFSTLAPVENNRHAVFVLGPPASGKSAISEPLARNLRAAIVDPDEAKKVIPEYNNGLGTMAAHEESSKLSRDVFGNLVDQGANIILPKVGANPDSIRQQMALLKEAGYTVDIAHVAATPEIAGRRNILRFLKTGRLVDPNYIADVGDKPRQTAYMLKGEANDFVDADTSKPNQYEILEGSGPLADTLRGGKYGGLGPNRGTEGGGGSLQGQAGGLIGAQVPGIQPHRVTAADGTSIDTAPVVVEADSLRTSQDPGYDPSLQPRQRDRAASQAQVRDIATNLDPERLGYSSEADRGAPIVGSDGMVESGNGRVLALRSVYDQGGPAAQAYRAWLSRQGVDVAAYRNPVLVRQRITPLAPDERRAFTIAANQAATLSMSAPERALADARLIDANAISLIHNPDDLGSAANRAFVRRFVAQLPQGEQGMMADAKGALSADGLARVRNAVLAKAYGDAGLLSRIAESTNDEVRSISSALTAVAPAWARLRAEIDAGRVRPGIDATADLLEAVRRTADLRARGEKLDEYLAQRDAFQEPGNVEDFMQTFYDPKGRRAASAQRITDALRFYAQEAGKVSAEEGLGLGLVPVRPEDILRHTLERQREGYGTEEGLPNRSGAGYGANDEASRGETRGPWLGEAGARFTEAGDAGDQEAAVRAQQLTVDEQRRLASEPVPLAGGRTGEQFVFPGTERITAAELAKRRAAEPLRPKAAQRPLEEGLFGDTSKQADLVDQAAAAGKAGWSGDAAERVLHQDGQVTNIGQLSAEGKARLDKLVRSGNAIKGEDPYFSGHHAVWTLVKPVDTGVVPPQIRAEAPNATVSGPNGNEVRPGTQAVSGAKQSQRAIGTAPIRRPEQLSLFGGGAGERSVFDANDAVSKQPGSPEATVPGPGTSVTKPPARSERDRSSRHNLPAVAGLREAETKIAQRSRSNYRITDEDQIGVGGPKQKVRANIDAIRLLKTIEDEARDATPGEKAQLVKYVGWGAFAQEMFDTRKPEWKPERDALRALLTDEEYNAAKGSTVNAHYTTPDVIRGMWDAINHLGYDGGMALEPAAGVGHFIGLIPDKVAPKTAWTAVELDPLTGRIAKALYGGAEVNVHGFEKLKRPSNYYDLAISNVPFGDYPVNEKPYGSFSIHNFFFVKSIDKVRPGGVVSFITSRFSMDEVDPSTRRLLAKSADLIGAIRLPGGSKGAFAKNAGTAVTTDILFLRKKIPGEATFPGSAWENLKEVQTPEGPVQINEYFADHPEMMLGEMRLLGTQWRDNEPVLIGDSTGLQDKIAAAAQNMPRDAFTERESPAPPPISGDEIATGIKDDAFFMKDGELYQHRQGQGFAHPLSEEDHDRVKRLIGMRDMVNDLLGKQLSATEGQSAAESGTALARKKLQAAYDAFVEKHGPINKEEMTVTSRKNKAGEPVVIVRRPNIKAFREDPDSWKVAAIEKYDPDTGKASRADIQTKDVINPPRERQINGPSDALAASLDSTGGVDLDHIAQSLNLNTQDEVVHALGDMIYQNPDGRTWETADNYLSGNVVKKLEDARDIAKEDPSYMRNVSALEKVQPEPLTGSDITAQFGAPWVPADVYESFLEEIGGSGVKVTQVPITGEWRAKAGFYSRDARSKYGTDRVAVDKIVDAALNNKQLTVWDEDHEGNKSVNDKATTEARVKAELLKEAFAGDMDHGIDSWAFADPERAQRLEGIYNRTYNNLVQRKFDGSHLTLPGLNPDFAGRAHRNDAIWRIIQNGNTLLAHYVGSGKTATMIAAGMEQKRLGLISKPAYVIPNHMLEQFSREFIQAYPDSKILVAQKDETTRENRKEFLAKVAANDWDGIIITHDAFGRINMGQDFRKGFIQEQMDELERVMRAEKDESGKNSPTVKALEKSKKRLQGKLDALLNEERKDAGTTFEESGIDHLFVDEAHKFKNLNFITRLQRVKGLAQGDSQRAEDLFLKIRYLEQKRPGRSAVFATGTPVSNTMAELWTMMRYLELDKLKERGLDTFDNWANTFGRVVNNMELSADGRTFKEVSSFSKFVNVPELISLYSEIADTKTADMLNLPRPEVKTKSGAPGIEIVQATPSAQEEEHIQKLVALAESLKGKRPEPGQPNMLSVVTAGRKVATDGRLISPDFEFNPQGKIAKAVENISRIYKEGNADPSAPNKVQMVFLDMGVPKTRAAAKPKRAAEAGVEEEGVDPAQAEMPRINLYADIKQRLVDMGIPANEIAAIHDATDDAKKAKLFQKVRQGQVRVILGSSEKMGVGTNVQNRLIAMHHLDAPWKPAEVEQRDGRIVRQGNMNPNVQIYRYVTKKSFDAFMWQKLDTKSKFIGQVLSGAKGSRHAEDIDNPLPEAAEMKAAASGDPRIIEHAELDRQVRALTAQRRSFEATKSRATWEVGTAKARIEQYENTLPGARDDAAMVQDLAGPNFSVDLGGTAVTDRKAAGQAILDRLSAVDPRTFYSEKVINLGKLSGFDMNVGLKAQWDGDGAILRATTFLKGKSAYSSPNDTVINPQTDPGGLIRRFENILNNIKQNPSRLEGEMANEQDSVKRLEKTLAQTWPKEKDYRDAIAKLDDLTKSLKGPNHPDVAEAEEAEVRAQRPAPPFYSAVDRTIQNAKQEKATPDQWLGMLRNAPGVKPEEMEWLGLGDWLKDQKGQVTKQQIADYVRANNIDLKEVTKGSLGPRPTTAQSSAVLDWAAGASDNRLRSATDTISAFEHGTQSGRVTAEALEALGVPDNLLEPFRNYAGGEQGPKFRQWTLPGGENYREMLLTLPVKSSEPLKPNEAMRDVNGRMMVVTRTEDPRFPDGNYTYRDAKTDAFRSSHWDEPNVLAHVRFDDRMVDGKKTLHVAEIQSDWHQKGRKQGYATDAVRWQVTPTQDGRWALTLPDQPNTTMGVYADREMAEHRRKQLVRDTSVPDAPFKTTWPELALKRMLRYAAENGYDRLSWDTGDTNAQRYDLSKKISSVSYKDGKLVAYSKDDPGRDVINEKVPPEKLADYVGKDVAEKLVAAPQDAAGFKTLSGLELRVGGEGMKAFYDKMLPAAANKLVKKFGAKVGTETVDVSKGRPTQYEDFADYQKAQKEGRGATVHSIDITPDLRDAATQQGFPLFRRGWEVAEGRNFGPRPDEKVVPIGKKTQAYVKPTEAYTAAEKKIADAVAEIGARMAPQATVRGAAALRMEGSPIWGAFVNSRDFPQLIAWSLERGNAEKIAGTVRHEIIHHLRNSGLIRPDEWTALHDAAVKDDWIGKYNIEDRYPGSTQDQKIEEAVAEHFSQWRTERSIEKPGFIRDAFQRLDLFMRRVAAAARSFLGKDATANDVLTRIETGEVGARRSEQIEAQKAYQGREAAQTPGEEARGRREGLTPRTIGQQITHFGDTIRAKSAEFAKSIGLDQIVQEMQMKVAPMAARNATVQSRAIAKEFMNARRQARQAWNEADKYILKNFSHDERRDMWNAADEESVAIQQGRPTAGIGLDRLRPDQRAVVEMLQARGRANFQEAKDLKMVEGEGLPSYTPRMLVRMSEAGERKRGAGEGAEVVRDIRTLAVANANLENAIATRRLVDTIAEAGKRSGNPTVNDGGAPVRSAGPLNTISHVLDEFGRGTSATTPQLMRRKYLTAEETEAAANRVPTPDENAPHWFTLTNPAFQRLAPRMVDADPKTYRDAVKKVSGMTVENIQVPARDEDGNIIFDRKPIYIREEFEGPLRSVLSRDNSRFYRGLMALKGKVMSVVMFSPLIHNQVEWGRALPAAPGKVVTFQTYLEGNKIANDPAQMREAISGGVVPIGGHGYMQDIVSIAEAPTLRPGRGLVAAGLGHAVEGVGQLTRLYDPRSTSDQVRGAVDWFGNLWHNTLLWDRVRDLQMGLWSHLKQHLVDKGYDPYSANVAAAHFANRYAGALPLEAMSGMARGVANVLLFSRSFTLGNLGAYKDAVLGLPRDAQALIQQNLGWGELQKVQSYVKRKSRAMLAIDAGLFYATLSALQSSFNVAGVGHTVGTLGGMIAGGALGGRGGTYGRLAAAVGMGAAGYGLASVLGASQGTRDLEDELGRYWTRFKGLLGRIEENPLETLGNPFKMIDSLGATAENEPGKQSRILMGYDKDGTAIYGRLAAGKVTEELMGYLTEPNEMLHRKLGTFARPLSEIYNNDYGFGRKVYNPKADTPGEVAKNIIKIGALLVGDQIPLSSIKGAYDWLRGGQGSDTAGIKAVAPLFGTTVSSGYPGGPELGVLADAKARQDYRQQEALPGIRDQIRQGDLDGAYAKMNELHMPPWLQRYYVATTQNPSARLTKRKMQDFIRSASPEEQQRFLDTQRNRPATEGAAPSQASGGAIVARAAGGRVEPKNINHNPTPAQAESGNYAKDRLSWNGIPLTIENAKGSIRRGIGKDGPWQSKLPANYGYARRSEGADGDALDFYLGPHTKSPHVFVVDQVDADSKKFDEHKILAGFGSKKQAVEIYKRAFSDGKGHARIGHVREMTVDQLKHWMANADTTKPIEKHEAEKATHAEVHYVAVSQKGARRCAVCKHFIAPNACQGVQSPISPRGWCERFGFKRSLN